MSKDMVNHPEHYADKTSLECIEVMELILGTPGTCHYCLGNAFKYIWRYKYKNGMEDLEKARWYKQKTYELLNRMYDLYDCKDENGVDYSEYLGLSTNYWLLSSLVERIYNSEKAAKVMPTPVKEYNLNLDDLREISNNIDGLRVFSNSQK